MIGKRRYGRAFTADEERRRGCEATSKLTFLMAEATPFRRMLLLCSVKTMSFVIGMTLSYNCSVTKCFLASSYWTRIEELASQ
jgi:hypothetical protein